MYLHNNKLIFDNILYNASKELKIDYNIIEKDYYVTLFLKELVKIVPGILFKGGTSLSKCHKVINRFSEDIDLSLNEENYTISKKRKLKYEIIELCDKLGFTITNISDIRSRRKYNCYKIKYNDNNNSFLNDGLLVETVFMVKAHPYEQKEVTSIIYDYLLKNNKKDIIEEYDMKPFLINVQTLQRTFIDKVFAICDYYLSNKTIRLSRHIYDLYMLKDYVKFDNEFKELVKRVKEDRKEYETCYSAKDDVDINKILKEIVESKYFYKDYVNVTENLLYKVVKYEKAIKIIDEVIESKVFDLK